MAQHHYETLQQVFDDAYRGLAAQGWSKSANASGRCAYRGTNGRKCAIGHCIADSDYSPKIEYASIVASGSSYPEASELFDRLFSGVGRQTLSKLQAAHDYAESREERKALFHKFAEERGLTIPSIEGAA